MNATTPAFAAQALVLVLLLAGCAATKSPVPAEPTSSAGFDGPPISLGGADLDPTSRAYLARVRQMIKAKWSYPCVRDATAAACEYKPARLVIDFRILADGRVGYVAVKESSGLNVYDEQAVQAVRLASPFPRVPTELMARGKPGAAGVVIHAAFEYKLERSAPCGDGAACD